MDTNWEYRRGDVYLANLNPINGSEQGGKRPVLVISNNNGNHYSSVLIIAPLTSRDKSKWLPTQVRLPESFRALGGQNVIMLEQIRTIDKERIVEYLGKVNFSQMAAVEVAIIISLGLFSKKICERRDTAVEVLNKHRRNRSEEQRHSSTPAKHTKA